MKINNEMKIGLVVIAAAAILLGLTVKAGNFNLKRDGYRVKVIFNDIDGVKINSPVMVNGFEIGQVEDVAIQPMGVELTLWIKNKAKLKEGTKAIIKNLGFMGEKYVALTAGSPSAEYLQPGAVIHGQAPVDFAQLLGDGHQFIGQLSDIAGNVNARLKTNEKNIDQILTNCNALVANMNSASLKIDQALSANKGNIDGILSHLNVLSQHLESAAVNLDEMSYDLKKNPWKLLRRESNKTK
ncbi:MAG: MCE family protein [Candidatus Omnitrophica bacterium]|nr:MCE family protein [Candidatus Omnitrophota bacterium]